VYRTTVQNISDAQAQSQIDILNADFAGLNADSTLIPTGFKPLFGKSQIRFCLAVRDPQGNPTTGILRKLTTTTTFNTNDGVKSNATGGSDAWATNKYLNLWCCNLGTSLLGYAQFPGGAAATDGVAINYRYFGNSPATNAPFNKGRTATHEVGHWMGLYHIWGDANCGNDQISDTPTQQAANSGCPTFPKVTCSNGANGDMFMNYMDYVDDGCMQMFSKGQMTKMASVMATTRASLASSDGCLPVTLAALDASVQSITSLGVTACATAVTPVFVFKNYGTTPITTAELEYTVDGGAAVSYTYNGNLASLATTTITMPTSATLATGAHSVVINIVSINGVPDANTTTANTLTQAATITGGGVPVIEVVEGFAGGFAATGFTITNDDNLRTWKDTTAFTLTPKSAYMDNFNYSTGNGKKDDFALPVTNMSGKTYQLDFDVAYTYYSVDGTDCGTAQTGVCSYDTLVVLLSNNCGATFSEVYRKQKDLLKTAPSKQTAFYPTATQWRHETIILTGAANSPEAIVKFRNISNYENNLYIDNINLAEIVSTESATFNAKFALQPNPATNEVRIGYASETTENATIEVFDALGKRLESITWEVQSGSNNYVLNTTALPSGIYNVVLRGANKQGVQKLVITK
jgi:Pregnancy-associated plasma protein-A/Secretion system C-terminal sorting domain